MTKKKMTRHRETALQAGDEKPPGDILLTLRRKIYTARERNSRVTGRTMPEPQTRNPPRPDAPNEVDDLDSRMGDDLDVPGSELDDPEESIGEEDEENNYYSLEDQDDDVPPKTENNYPVPAGKNHAYDHLLTYLIIVAVGSDAAGEFLWKRRDLSRF